MTPNDAKNTCPTVRYSNHLHNKTIFDILLSNMNAKERVNTAMSGKIPDRVPVIPQICYPHAILALGMDYRQTVIEVQSNPNLANELVLKCALEYGVDGMRAFMPHDPIKTHEEGGEVWEIDSDGNKIGRIDFNGGGYSVPIEEKILIHDRKDIDKIEVMSADEIMKKESFVQIRDVVKKAGNNLFLISSPPTFTVQYVTLKRGKIQAMMDLMDDPDFVFQIQEKALEVSTQYAIALCKAGIDGLMLGDTYSGVISPKQFGKFSVPYFKKFVNALRPYGKKIYLHVCGNSTGILEMMAGTGVDCIEPLDPLGGVVVADAKKRVGNRVALMGGVDTRILAHGTLEDTKNDCIRCLEQGMTNGAYLLAAGDMLPTETSPEKVKLMMELAKTVGKYDN